LTSHRRAIFPKAGEAVRIKISVLYGLNYDEVELWIDYIDLPDDETDSNWQDIIDEIDSEVLYNFQYDIDLSGGHNKTGFYDEFSINDNFDVRDNAVVAADELKEKLDDWYANRK
jgi:hypothetical protein